MSAINRVRVGGVYTFRPVMWDVMDRHALTPDAGTRVRVINVHGAPEANTMGHCYVETMEGVFCGLVHCNSLRRE